MAVPTSSDPVAALLAVYTSAKEITLEQARGADGVRCTRRQILFQNVPITITPPDNGTIVTPVRGLFRFDLSSFDSTDRLG